MPSEAVALIREAADRGDPAAMAYTAVLAADGIEEPQSWSTALERLALAAEAGSILARNQLRALSGQGQAQGGWPAVAGAVDLEAWLAPGDPQPLGDTGRIHRVDGLLPEVACWWLVQQANGRLTRATVYGVESGLVEHELRTNSYFEFGMRDLDVVVLVVRAKVARTLDIAGAVLEPLQVLHYAPGQTFRPHYDFLHADQPAHAADMAARGQRIVTVLMYLNAGYEGGETEFPLLDVRYKGAAGDALMFANVDARGRPDRRMLHAGLPPVRGEKWLATQWVRRPRT